MQRRHFVKNLLLSSAALGYWSSGAPFVFRPKAARAAQGKTLVNIFQRGGCDGLNMVVPYAEERYYQLRPSIAIPRADSGLEGAALDLNGFFGLHPSMAGLHQLYQQNQLAILPATHYPEGSRSHFDSQHYIESAQAARSGTGWLNRHLASHTQGADVRALSIGNDLVQSMRGEVSVSTLSNFNSLGFGVDEQEELDILEKLQEIYDHPTSELINHQLVHSFGQQMLEDIGTLQTIGEMPYAPENGAEYPSSGFGNDLQILARVLKANVGLEIANINIGGWDTHSGQGGASGSQASRLQDLSDGLTAFYTDMGANMADIAILIGTEFGRTSAENGSAGTDHGFASAWMVLGGGVSGGIYGSWPGLAEDQLHSGRYLAMATDYRDIYGDILSGFLGNSNTTSVLPGHNYTSIGIF